MTALGVLVAVAAVVVILITTGGNHITISGSTAVSKAIGGSAAEIHYVGHPAVQYFCLPEKRCLPLPAAQAQAVRTTPATDAGHPGLQYFCLPEKRCLPLP